MKREWLRPAVHAGALGFVFLEPVLGPRGMAATGLVAFLLNAFLLPRTAFGKALRREGDPWWNGQLSYPLAISLAYLLFVPGIAEIAWAVMALGDPAAFVVGTGRTWRARLPWNRRKSWAGTAAFLLPAWAGGLATLWAVSGMPPDGHTRLYAVLMTGVAAAVGAIVESLPLPVDDNIPVTLAVGGVLSWMTTGL